MTLALHGKTPQRRTALTLIALFTILAAIAAGLVVRAPSAANAAGTTNWSGPTAVAGGSPSCSDLTGAFGIEDLTFATCDDGESLVLSEYGLAGQMPANAIGLGIVVGLRANSGSPDGLDTFSFEISGDGGATYTTPFATPDVNRPAFGEWAWHFPAWETCGGFGKTWSVEEFSDANFRVRATANVDPSEPEDVLLLEGIFIKVCWTNPPILTGPDVSLSAGSTTGDTAGAGESFGWVLTTYNFPDLLEPLNLSVVVPDGFQITGLDSTAPGFACEPPIGQEIECLAEGAAAVDRQLTVNVIAPDGSPDSECGPHTLNAAISGGGGTITIPTASHTVTVTCLLVPPPPPGPVTPAESGTLVNRKVLVGGDSNEYFSFRVIGSPAANGYQSAVSTTQEHVRTMPVGSYFVEEFEISDDYIYLGSVVAVGSLAAPACPPTPPATGLGTNVTVPANGTVLVCHYNQIAPKGTLVNRKVIVGGTSTEWFGIEVNPLAGPGAFTSQVQAGNDSSFTLDPGTYFVGELPVDAGFAYLGSVVAAGSLAAPACPPTPPSSGVGVNATVPANGSVLVCHYNQVVPHATIINRKVITGGSGTETFKAEVDATGVGNHFTASFTTSAEYAKPVTPGEYTSVEVDIPLGYTYLGAVIVPVVVPSLPNACPPTPPNTFTGVTFDAPAGSTIIVCHYNTKIPTLAYATIENRKIVVNAASTQVFEAAVDGPGAADYTATFDPSAPHVKNVGAFGNYNSTEVNVPAGFEYLGAILLTPSNPNCPATPPNGGMGVNFSVAKGDHVIICHYNRVTTKTTTTPTPTPTTTPGFTPTPTTTPTVTTTPPTTTSTSTPNTPSQTAIPTTPEPIVREPDAEPTPIAPSTGESFRNGNSSAGGVTLAGLLLALAGLATGTTVVVRQRRQH